MRFLKKLITTLAAVIAALSACCLDSENFIFFFAVFCVSAGILLVAGLVHEKFERGLLLWTSKK